MKADNVELLKRMDPAQFYEQFLAEGVYPDGRELTRFRHTIIECAGSNSGYQVFYKPTYYVKN